MDFILRSKNPDLFSSVSNLLYISTSPFEKKRDGFELSWKRRQYKLLRLDGRKEPSVKKEMCRDGTRGGLTCSSSHAQVLPCLEG